MTLRELVAAALDDPGTLDRENLMSVAAIRAVATWLRTEAGDPAAGDAFAAELMRVADLLDEEATCG
jgi:hypothetical protein